MYKKFNDSSVQRYGILPDDWAKANQISQMFFNSSLQINTLAGAFLKGKNDQSELCMFIQKTQKGNKECRKCHKNYFNNYDYSKNYNVFTCFAGLKQMHIPLSNWTFVLAPGIIVKENYNIKIEDIATFLNVNYNSIAEAVHKTSQVSEEQFCLIANLISSLITNSFERLEESITNSFSNNNKIFQVTKPASSLIKVKAPLPLNIYKKNQRRVVITGLGVISSIGIGKKQFLDGIYNGKSGIRLIKKFDELDFPSKIAGKVDNFDPLKYFDRRERIIGRATQFAVAASKMAIEDSNLKIDELNSDRIGVYIGSSTSGMEYAEEQHIKYLKNGKVLPFTSVATFGGATSSAISIKFGITGPSVTFANGCCSSTDAIGIATNWIKNDKQDIMIAGGTEAHITEFICKAFCATRLLSKRNHDPEHASRPFDLHRDGMVMGEGSGILVLEEFEHAKSRGASIYGEILGYAASEDAYHIIRPEENGIGAIKSMIKTIEDAGVGIKDIDMISAHGTSTVLNDKIETKAIKSVFGEYAYKIPVSAMKSMTGHTEAASGAIEVIGLLLAMKNGFIPPTINQETSDPECDLDYVPNCSRKQEINIVLKNSFAFGGKNACLIIGRFM